MEEEKLDIEKMLKSLTLDEKLRMLSGDKLWHTFGAAGLPRVRMSDGPCGLRAVGDGAGATAAPATCFPTPSMLANSWDPALLYDVGAAIGREATAMGVNLLLAPGINVKRNPLGGRNFEYFSEDPYLSGTLGAAFVSGVQSTGVGACIKHFAANNQESYRMYSDSIVDPRALREIYIKPFEIALEAEPAAVMCAYNKLNGEYCSQNKTLLTDVLRDELGFKGITLSDWGAVRDRAKSLAAGLDLEMPDSNDIFEQNLKDGLRDGIITETDVDNAVRRILELIDNVYLEPRGDFDDDANDRLSYNAAAASVVLLKNDGGFLPLTRDKKLAVMGALAENCPYQGGGSSHVTALRQISPLDAFTKRGLEVTYFPAYSTDVKENAKLYEAALDGAKKFDACVVFAGVPSPAEGVDRESLELPPEQNKLIDGLTAAGHRVVVVLTSPGPVRMAWVNRVRAILYNGLNGPNGALAAVDVLCGRINPRGRLAETFPVEYEDFGADFGGLRTLYRESIFVGYRYYDATERPVLFPFGHGLSFSDVTYDDMRVKRLGDNAFDVTVTLTNRSARDAYETVQIYVSDRTGRIMCPRKQLASYKKVHIEGMTATTVTVHLDKRAFEFFDPETNRFAVCDGEFKIMAAASAADVKKQISVKADGNFVGKIEYPDCYKSPLRGNIADDDFAALYGAPLPADAPRPTKGEFTLDSCLYDMRKSSIVKIIIRSIKRQAKSVAPVGSPDYNSYLHSSLFTPLCGVASMSDGAISPDRARGIVEFANGNYAKGLKLLMKK